MNHVKTILLNKEVSTVGSRAVAELGSSETYKHLY